MSGNKLHNFHDSQQIDEFHSKMGKKFNDCEKRGKSEIVIILKYFTSSDYIIKKYLKNESPGSAGG